MRSFPQWVCDRALDRKKVSIAIRIACAEPYARDYHVQYWGGGPATA